MKRTRVKICGITTVEAALHAVACGVDALGFVFYDKSPRAVDLQQARTIIEQLPAFVTTVGLFVNAPAEYVSNIAEQTPLDLLQFHGDESDVYCLQFNRPFIKAIRVQSAASILQADAQYPHAQALLLDTYVKGVQGGTGSCFDWTLIPKKLNKAIILAGGLNSSNVAAAIAGVSPYAVDVSGGVESQKGIKNLALISEFTAVISQSDVKRSE